MQFFINRVRATKRFDSCVLCGSQIKDGYKIITSSPADKKNVFCSECVVLGFLKQQSQDNRQSFLSRCINRFAKKGGTRSNLKTIRHY